MRPNQPRQPTAGPPTPSPPFPIPVSGPIVKGFGRGSAELGIPTANIPLSGLSVGGHSELESGVYYGWAGVSVDIHGEKLSEGEEKKVEEGSTTDVEQDEQPGGVRGEDKESDEIHPLPVPGGIIFPMVLSLGYNPYYKNTVRSLEVHMLHKFKHDFYGARMNLLICGFVREEYDYVSKEALVEDIMVDCEVARRSLGREGYRSVIEEERWRGGLIDFGEIGEGEGKELNGKMGGKV